MKLRLNIGSGDKKLPGFVNIDLEAGADLQWDVRWGLPFPDNSVDVIFNEHFIEHITQPEAIAFLRECRRVLKPGGRIRIATPDLHALAYRYLHRDDWKESSEMVKYGFEWIHNPAEQFNIAMREWGHQWIYDEVALTRIAREAGLENGGRYALGQSRHPDLQGLEYRPGSTLIMEFEKVAVKYASEQPLVSIVMPVYKPTFFREALQSALNQTYPRLEIVICDDSEGEAIETIVRELAGEDSRVRYVKNETNLGSLKNYLRVFELARGDFIKFLNDDDLLMPHAVERMVRIFLDFPDVTLVTSYRRLIDEAGRLLPDEFFNQKIVNRDSWIDGVSLANWVMQRKVNVIGEPTTVMFRRREAAQIEPHFFCMGNRQAVANGDVNLWVNLLGKGDAVYLVEPLSRFRLHKEQFQRQPGYSERGARGWEQLAVDARRMGFLQPHQPQMMIALPLEHASPENRLLLRAWERFAHNDMDGAERYLKTLPRSVPDIGSKAQYWFVYGKLEQQRGRRAAAQDYFKRAVRLNPEFSDARQALEAFGGEIASSTPEATYDPSAGEHRSSPPVEAGSTLDEKAALGELKRIHSMLERGDWDAALPALNNLKEKLPPVALLWNEIGVCFYQIGLHEEALAAFRKAYALDAKDKTVIKNLAELLTRLEELESAALLYAQIFQMDDRDEDALNFAGKLAYLMGRVDTAESIFNHVLRMNPDDSVAQQNLRFLAHPDRGVGGRRSFSEPVMRFVADVEIVARQTIAEHQNRAPSPEAVVRPCPSCGGLGTLRARYMADIVTCVDCGLTYLRRLPEAGKLKMMYDLYADEFSHMRLPRDREEVKQSILRREPFLRELRSYVRKVGKILDVGCGWGAFLDAAREFGFEPYGIEITPSAVHYANSRLHIPVDSRPLEEQAFEKNSFSLVTMNHVLEHLPNTRQVLDKVFSILEPGGVFAGMVPNFQSFCSEMEREHWEWLDPNFHYVHFTPKTLQAILEQAGFVVEKIYTVRGDYSLNRIKGCVYQKYGPVDDREFEEIVQQLEASGKGEEIRFFARKPESLPEGVSRPREQRSSRPQPRGAEPLPEKAPSTKAHRKRRVGTGAPDFSVVIPVFNQVKYTRMCLEKIYHSADEAVSFEVIVVDNGSTDETPEYMKEACKRYPNLKYVRSETNLKYAGGCNLGARHARGTYVVFLNNDTEPQAGWLEKAWKVFGEEKNVGVLGAKLLYPDRTIQHCGIEFQNSKIGNNFIWPLHRYRHAREDNPLANRREDVHAVTGACLFISRKLFKQVGGFDEEYGMYFEDTDLCFKVREKGKRVVYDPDIVVIHHEGKSTENLEKIHEWNRKAAQRFYRKWEDQLVDIALDVLIERVDGKYYYFSEFFYPREFQPNAVSFLMKMLNKLGRFYALMGGVGDALLFLSTFYDDVDDATVVCVPNNPAAARILLNQFPKISKVYFFPYPSEGVWHYALRKLWSELKTCLGMGVTPTDGYDVEWTEGLDIFQKYGVNPRPKWVKQMGEYRLTDFQVTLQPKGSIRGMVGSKRNIIRPRDWIRLQKLLIENGITPVLLGSPDERAFYPALKGAIDKRSYNLIEQMRLVASSDLFIGADSWGKTMAALAGIPTFVFRACRGKELQHWVDPSEHVFMRPWRTMVVVDTFEELIEQLPRHLPHPLKTEVDYSAFVLQNKKELSPYFNLLIKPDQIFLYRSAGLGDVLMAFPLVRALKEQFPEKEIHFCTAYAYKPLVDANPDIDRFIPPEVLGQYLVFESHVIDLNRAHYGYAPQHQVDAFLHAFRLELPAEKKSIRLKIPSMVQNDVERKLQEILEDYRLRGAQSWNKMVLLHPAQGDVNRTWPRERWEELARLLVGSGNLVIVVGHSSASTGRGIHPLNVEGVYHLEDQLSPLEFVALCRKADVLVSTDSGPIQLAGATDIAIVGIYSVVRGHRRLPYRKGEMGWNAVAVEPSCPFKGCYEKMNDEQLMQPYLRMIEEGKITPASLFSQWCVNDDKYACMQHQIGVEQVWEALQPFLFSDTDEEGLLAKADQFLKIRRPDEALKLLEGVVSQGNASARVLRTYIELLKQTGDRVNYILYLEQYVNNNPEDAGALNELGVVRWQQERIDEAIALFEKAVSHNGNHPDHIKNLADAYLAQEDFEKAVPLYVYLIQKYPEDSEAYQRLAMLYIENGDYDSARLLLDKALEYHPRDRYLQDWRKLLDTPKVFLAYQFINAGELEIARTLLEEALTENPEHLAARLGLGSVLFHQQQYDAARKIYQQTLEQYPDNTEALFYRAKIAVVQQDWESFNRLRRQYHQAFQNLPELRKLYIQGLIDRGEFESALQELDEYLGRFPDDADGYIILGNLFYEGGKSQEALNFYHRALQLEPENEEIKKMVENLGGNVYPSV